MGDTLLQQLSKTDRNPAQESQYKDLLSQAGLSYFQGGNGSSGIGGVGSGGGGDYASIVAQQLKMMQDANAPAVASLQASIPELQQRSSAQSAQLTAQQAPMEQRYQNLLTQISQNQLKEESRVSTAGARELGRRGISSESGFYDQYQNEKLSPVSQYYGGLSADTGLSREDAIRTLQNQISNVPLQYTQEERAIKQAIADLMAGGNQAAITQGLGIYQQNQEAERQRQAAAVAAEQNAAAQRQRDIDNSFRQSESDFAREQTLLANSRISSSSGGGVATYYPSRTEPKPTAPPSTGMPSYFTQVNSPVSSVDYSRLQSRPTQYQSRP